MITRKGLTLGKCNQQPKNWLRRDQTEESNKPPYDTGKMYTQKGGANMKK